MISFQELLQQLDLQPSPEEVASLEVGIHLASIRGTPDSADITSRDIGWHMDRLTAILASAAAEVFFDEFGRYCGRIVLASLDDEDEQRFLEGVAPGPEMLTKPLGKEAWIIEGEFLYGAIRSGRRLLKQVLSARGIETLGYIVHRRSAVPVAKIWALDWLRDVASPMSERSPSGSFLRAGQLRHEAKTWLVGRQAIGAAMRVLASSDRFRALSLNDAMCLLLGPITLGQYEIGCTVAGKPISFRSWAYFTEHAMNRLTTQGPRSLSDGCWNQGSQKTLVCDWPAASRGAGGGDGASAAVSSPGWSWAVLPESKYSIFGDPRRF